MEQMDLFSGNRHNVALEPNHKTDSMGNATETFHRQRSWWEFEQEKKAAQDWERYQKLSDREKRALAAERRILSQSGTVKAECFLCKKDIAGQVPFEYMMSRFCSMECAATQQMQYMALS